MTFDLTTLPPSDRYKLLASLVTPRPIAWVTTVGSEGVVNAAPFSFFNVFGSNPPIVTFAPGNKDKHTPKDTARNIRETGEFVIHLIGEDLAQAMVNTSATLPHGESELAGLNLTTAPSKKISVPRIIEAPVALECTQHTTLEIGSNRLIIGVVHLIHAKDGLINEDLQLDPSLYHPIGRMASPDRYCRSSDQFEISSLD